MFQEFEPVKAELAAKELKKKLQANKKQLKQMLSQDKKSFSSLVLPYLMMDEHLTRFFAPIGHLNGVQNSKKTQKAIKECLPLLTKYHSELSQNEQLFVALKQIKEAEFEKLTNEEKKALEDELKEFRLGGVDLPKAQKAKLTKIDMRLSEIENDFSQNVLDDTNSFEMTTEDAADVSELPKVELEAAKVIKNGKIHYRFTLQQPSYLAYMTYGTNRALREKLYKAYVTRGAKNEKLMDEILSLRQQRAKLVGFANYAEESLYTKMAKSSDDVLNFLYDLAKKSKEAAKKEFMALENFAKEQGLKGELSAYDITYYSEKLRKKMYDIDEEHYKQYFEKNETVRGMFEFLKMLFGVEFVKVKAKVWHKSVAVYEMREGDKPRGRLYVDLENRKNKKSGAWMDNWVSACVEEDGRESLPVAFIVCNFPSSSKSQKSLLRHYDVETLFHEMGHAIHHLFSKVKVPSISGVNGVAWDAVEFPSQWLENFVFDKEVLKLFAKHYESGEPLNDADIEKLKNAKNFQSAMQMMRQLEFAIFDFKLHCGVYQGEEVQKLLDEVRDDVAVVLPPSYNKMQHSFTHVFAGGYAAGYYSYKWAELLSSDAYMIFADSGIFADDLAGRFKEAILESGGSADMNLQFEKFANRAASSDAMLILSGIKAA